MSAPSPSCPDDAAARRLARSMAVVSAFCLTGDTMLYIALPLFWQECGLTALWQVGVLLAVNRLVRLPLNPLVRLLYTRIDQRTGMALAVVLAACLGGGACALALVALYLPAPLWLPLLLCSQLCATGLATLSDAAASDTAERHGHPTHTLASYAFIVDCGAAAGPVLAYGVQGLWGMDAAYLTAAALLLCLLPLWMRKEATNARS